MNSKFTTKISISKNDFDNIEKVFYDYFQNNNYDKDFSEYLLFCHDTKFTDYKTIVENWKTTYPNLNVYIRHAYVVVQIGKVHGVKFAP